MNANDFKSLGQLSQDFSQTRFAGRPFFTHDEYLEDAPGIFYVRNRWSKLKTRLEETALSVQESLTAYNDKLFNVVQAFQPLLTSYDYEIILPTTCGLGMVKPHHFNVMALDHFYPKRNHEIPSPYIDALWVYYKDSFDPSFRGGLSMPRGRNTGWPTPRGIRSRDLSDALLAAHAALAIGGKSINMTLAQLADAMQRMYGPWFSIAGERYQHSPKEFPVITGQGPFVSKNFEPRVRGIYFSPKFAVIYNRLVSKIYLHMILGSEMHTQDRAKLKTIIGGMTGGKFDFVCSLDVSGYDQGMGGQSTVSIFNVLAAFADKAGMNGQQIKEDFLAEIQIPLLIPTQSGMKLAKTNPILPSGASTTTIIGCTGSAYIVTRIVSTLYDCDPVTAAQHKKEWWDALTYGDDMVLALQSSRISSKYKKGSYDEILASIAQVGEEELEFKFDDEPTIKFLGQNYDMRTFKDSPTDYPVGRFLQQQFFPERVKIGPFARIGYIARLELINESIRPELHKLMQTKGLWEMAGLGVPFRYEDRAQVLQESVVECQKFSDKISQLDDILGVFTHGLSPEDIEFDLGMFEDLVGVASIDVSDPEKLVNPGLQRYVTPVANGRFELFPDLIREICRHFSLPVTGSYEVMV